MLYRNYYDWLIPHKLARRI